MVTYNELINYVLMKAKSSSPTVWNMDGVGRMSIHYITEGHHKKATDSREMTMLPMVLAFTAIPELHNAPAQIHFSVGTVSMMVVLQPRVNVLVSPHDLASTSPVNCLGRNLLKKLTGWRRKVT
jgi:hypothetical protein